MRSDELIGVQDKLPPHEVLRLLCVATGRQSVELQLGVELTPDQVAVFESLVARRLGNEPLQYIEGSVPFGSVEVAVDPRVLIPRPETEYLFELVVTMVSEPLVIVDLCTGSGNLALALKARFPNAAVYASDVSRDAISVARSNAEGAGFEINVAHGNLFDPIPQTVKGRVDLLVSNPPYLAEREYSDLPPDVRREPRDALVAGAVGDEVVRRIGEQIGDWMAPGGVVGIEVSEFHAWSVVDYFTDIGGTVLQDLTGRDRYVIGRLPFE
ncbi:MAG: peptide chain release factor N(5)-glutamine methyltransferase [Armatimonadetes bacterium]|nr:MAG: peptide chain release factor N(5)-glutamine methyltransferase [Armatimonadota bacterium]